MEEAHEENSSSTATVNFQDLDQYDFINAPQYVDFSDLARNDDPNADRFFETHREEDDFLIPFESLSPTIHLLNEKNNAVNEPQAEPAENMEDVEVVYYSPTSPQKNNNNNKAPGRNTNSLDSTSSNSFHTPMWEYTDPEAIDKENQAPSAKDDKSKGFDSAVKSCKKLSYSQALGIGITRVDSTEYTSKSKDNNRQSLSKSSLNSSLMYQLENLTILSSDEEDEAQEIKSKLESSIKIAPLDTLTTPPKILTPQTQCKVTSSEKLDFFEGLCFSPDQVSTDNIVELVASEKTEDVPKQIVETELFTNQEFPAFDETGEDRKQSFLIKDAVGQQVFWSTEELNAQTQHLEQVAEAFDLALGNDEQFEHNGDEGTDADETLTSSFNSYKCARSDEQTIVMEPLPQEVPNKRIAQARVVDKLTIPHSPKSKTLLQAKFPANKNMSFAPLSFPKNTGASAKPTNRPLKTSSAVSAVAYKGTERGRAPMKANHYVSLAEAVSNFQKNTPDRFRTLPRGVVPIKRSTSCDLKSKREKSPVQARSRSPQQRQGQPLSTAKRSRASSVSSQSRSLKSAIPQKKNTIPRPFKFATLKTRAVAIQPDVPDFKFKAKPAPKDGGHVKIPERQQLKCTQPVAPHFASDDRIRDRHEKKAQSAAHSPKAPATAQASRIPTVRHRINPAPTPAPIPVHKTTTMKPFSFDQRDQQMLLRKEEKIKQEIEEEMKIQEFHANPLPSVDPKLPKRKPLPATNVKPFDLKCDKRGVLHQENFRQKVEEEERKLQELKTFHARSPVVLHQPAFEPEHPPRSPLEPVDFHLFTEKRAVVRKEFDDMIHQKHLEEEMRIKEEQERLLELSKQHDMERRRQLVHKAQPFRLPKPFEVKALTIPHSPAFRPLPSQRRFTPMKLKSDPQNL